MPPDTLFSLDRSPLLMRGAPPSVEGETEFPFPSGNELWVLDCLSSVPYGCGRGNPSKLGRRELQPARCEGGQGERLKIIGV